MSNINQTYNPIKEIPKDWESLKKNIHKYMDTEGHRRLELEQHKYKDYITSQTREEAIANIKRMTEKNNLMPNPFGYSWMLINIPSAIHYLFWEDKYLTDSEIKNIVKTRLGDFDCVSYINSPANQTVPELKHYHVFINLNKSQ